MLTLPSIIKVLKMNRDNRETGFHKFGGPEAAPRRRYDDGTYWSAHDGKWHTPTLNTETGKYEDVAWSREGTYYD